MKVSALFYEMDEVTTRQWNEMNQALIELGRRQRLWLVEREEVNYDWKRHAGASSLIRRRPARILSLLPPAVRSNVVPYCIDFGKEQIYFFPDCLYFHQLGRYISVEYSCLNIDLDTVIFIEEEQLSQDAKIVGTTWKYINKDGSPDERFFCRTYTTWMGQNSRPKLARRTPCGAERFAYSTNATGPEYCSCGNEVTLSLVNSVCLGHARARALRR
ncbi:MAG TPA: hypothetical protein VFB38_10600 [Chthonomonadaceae bacterium]|nr:hypothetical protein [Chthonomonadaceae bacterium]